MLEPLAAQGTHPYENRDGTDFPVFLRRDETLKKGLLALRKLAQLAASSCVSRKRSCPDTLCVLERTHGAAFDNAQQKMLFARYLDQGVDPAEGHLEAVQRAASKHKIAVVLGIIERARDRGGYSLYCSCVFITSVGSIASILAKLMPRTKNGSCGRLATCGPQNASRRRFLCRVR